MLHVVSGYQPIFRRAGIDAELIFSHPQIIAWRRLEDRENCTLDATREDGSPIRLHVKRYAATRRATTPAEDEVAGFELLHAADIPTAPLVAWGRHADGRSFIATEDLAGYGAADKLVETGTPFDRLLNPTADLAAKLHRAGLHHRDLYLCHFFAKLGTGREDASGGPARSAACAIANEPGVPVHLIDVARVGRLPARFTRQRWIIKDLAEFWYSTLSLPIGEAQRDAWLKRYASQSDQTNVDPLRRAIARKVARIAKHDERLNRVQPGRNISIPQ